MYSSAVSYLEGAECLPRRSNFWSFM